MSGLLVPQGVKFETTMKFEFKNTSEGKFFSLSDLVCNILGLQSNPKKRFRF